MSKRIEIGYVDPKGAIVNKAGVGILIAEGTTVPADATTGYAPGCIFIKDDGTANATIYVNEGTATSSLFKAIPVTALAAISTLVGTLSGLTATVDEINQAADESANTEVVTATNIITAAESGKTFYLGTAGGFTSTLPAPAAGLRFRFIVKVAPTTAYIITTNASANIMFGMMLERAGTAGVAGAGRDTFNFVANQAIIADWVEFWSDGTNWYYHGMVDVAAGNTVAVT
jgi:hypothetical protein